jgi:hypothetical protein
MLYVHTIGSAQDMQSGSHCEPVRKARNVTLRRVRSRSSEKKGMPAALKAQESRRNSDKQGVAQFAIHGDGPCHR